MRIEEDLKLGFKDVLIRPKRSTLKSRSDVELERQFTFKHSGQSWSGVPIIAANMDTVGTFSMASALASFDILTAVHKHYSVEEWQAFINNSSADVLKHVMVSTGTSDADFEKTKQILDLNPALNFVCIDVANGYSEHFVQFVAKAREAWPTKTICAGNVVTGEMCEELILSGADIVKVGIGPGSVCTTRVKTGVGYPQLSAVIECADAAHGLGGMIVSDGGCTTPGDVAKAFGGGADFVMLGGMLAGHEESGVASLRRTARNLCCSTAELRVCDENVTLAALRNIAQQKVKPLSCRCEARLKIPREIFWAACVQLVHTLGLHA